MFLDSPTYCAPELEKFSADNLPVFPRAIFHVMELSAFWQSLVHGYLSRTEGLRIPICWWRIKNPTGPQRPAVSDRRASPWIWRIGRLNADEWVVFTLANRDKYAIKGCRYALSSGRVLG